MANIEDLLSDEAKQKLAAYRSALPSAPASLQEAQDLPAQPDPLAAYKMDPKGVEGQPQAGPPDLPPTAGLPGPMNADGSMAGVTPALEPGINPQNYDLFKGVSDKIKAGVGPATAAPGRATAAVSDKDDGDDSSAAPASSAKSSVNPIVAKYLQDQAGMKAAQAAAKENRLSAAISRAGGMLGHAISRSKDPLDESGYKNLDENANTPVTDIQTAQAAGLKSLQEQEALMQTKNMAENNDPSSARSVAFRQSIERLSPGIAQAYGDSWKDVAAADKDIVLDPIKVKEQIEGRKQVAAMHYAQLKQQKDIMLSEKQRIEDEKDATAIAGKLNYLTSSSRSALGRVATAKTSIDRLTSIVSDPNATVQDMNSAAADMNNVISGSTSISGTEHQAYGNLATDFAKSWSYITSSPQAPNVPEVKKHILDVAQKMNAISNAVIQHNSKMVSVGHEGWIARHPDTWNRMLAAQAEPDMTTGMSPSAMPAGLPNASPSIAPHPQDSQAVQWAKANPGDPRAAKILQANGIK